jgi:hypothetical protein
LNYRLIKQQEEFSAYIDLVSKIPTGVDIICGIPRHGMIPAAVIAEVMGRPLTAPGSPMWYTRNAGIRWHNNPPTIVIIDDSIGTAATMNGAKAIVSNEYPGSKIITAVAYTSEKTKDLVDVYAHVYPKDTKIMFHSQFMHSPWERPIGFDIDGVLGDEWPGSGDYDYFLEHARPYRIPAYGIEYIVTGRLEQYRAQTVKWLKNNGVEYANLIMLQDPNEDHGAYKARICRERGIKIFIESCRDQAEVIGRTPGVMCVHYDSGELFQ